ncbi:DUF1192 family protein [Falsiroseomonas sp. CW058]|uniref:DUF1192 family protein n=1 Tax=Falsiroseomonas sp. CW058 TaxID=3388664 RepID=UPI003D311646
MEDPEGPRPTGRFVPAVLDRWDVDDLRGYIGELRAEIARAEAEIGRRDAQKAAAEMFFKRPG